LSGVNGDDFYPMPPLDTELFGVPSGTLYLACPTASTSGTSGPIR